MPTTLGSVATTSIVAKGFRHAVYVQGDINTAKPPGYAYIHTAADDVYTLHNGSSHKMMRPFWLEFRHRTSSTFGEVDIDTNESTTADAKLLDPNASGDDIEWWAFTIDMSAAKYPGQPLCCTSGGVLLLGTAAVASSTMIACRIAPNYYYSSGDEVCKVCKP